MVDFVVPLDRPILEFWNHIKANRRSFLSSKFGDGKSYFLREFLRNDKILEEYEFLIIYPINYQVADNKDIFELIKRDILCQLLVKKIIPEDYDFSEKEILSWYIYSHGKTLVEDILECLSDIGISSGIASNIASSFKIVKLFRNISKGVKNYNNEIASKGIAIETLLDKVEKTGVYDCDPITKIIQDSIKEYKEKNKKKIALFIEDLDRIDPAHIFRILNILSAHIEYGYMDSYVPNFEFVNNKFNLDNIILVGDFDNIINIYHHLYGEYTDFKGYISKFLSSDIFRYSLAHTREKYVISTVSKLVELPEEIIRKILSKELMSSTTMREIVHSFDIDEQLSSIPKFSSHDKEITISTSFIKIIAILKRLRINKESIINILMSIQNHDSNIFYSNILPYFFYFNEGTIHDNDQCIRTFPFQEGKGRLCFKKVFLKEDGHTEFDAYTTYGAPGNTKSLDYKGMILKLFDFVR